MTHAKTSGRWARWRQGAFSIPLALVAAIGMIAITEVAYRAQSHSLDALVREGQARLRLLTAFQRLTEAESGKRGYLMLGESAYLLPYQRASSDVLRELESVLAAYWTDGHQRRCPLWAWREHQAKRPAQRRQRAAVPRQTHSRSGDHGAQGATP